MQIRDVDRVAGGSPERLSLRLAPDSSANTPEAARILARRHLSLRTAYAALTELADRGRAYVTVPSVEDLTFLKSELASVGVLARRHAPARIDVRAVRERRQLSQEAFSLRFGLDVSTVENWEQGRSEPDAAATTLLWTIFRHPEAVEASIGMDEDEPPVAHVK
ncbi:hypothetical protein Sa4125_13850 [Aureimonas sp. SA4125]|nr:hypothetical protein Sa4125_13850 [Aureimonas sp. SA4125]